MTRYGQTMQSDSAIMFIYDMDLYLMRYTLQYVALCSRCLLMSECPIFTKKMMLLCESTGIDAAVA